MKISFNALKRYVPLTVSAEECADTLTKLGVEVEGVEYKGYSAKGPVVVGKVLERSKHPNADRLSVCQVQISAQITKTIVCGANNFQAGDCVPVALPGSSVGGCILQKTKMRGVESEGMMCSGRELGLSLSSEGLLILPGQCVVGDPIEKYFPSPDAIFDLTIGANRGDCLSYLGIARELSAWYDLEVLASKTFSSLNATGKTEALKSFPQGCPLYTAWKIKGIKIEQSPDWLQEILENSGMRPINNVVDVTNLVLLECGQPLHAFDLSKIEGDIGVRSAEAGEKFIALNGQTYTLSAEMMVVADAKKPLAIAGIIGGDNSEVSEDTTEILLESAYFNPQSVRVTANKLALSTESSYRFERNVDSCNVENAAMRAIELLKDLQPSLEVCQVYKFGQPVHQTRTLTLPFNQIERLGGLKIPLETVENILQRLQFKTQISPDLTTTTVEVPAFRQDVGQPVDLIEEILRIYGTDKIPSRSPTVTTCTLEDDPVRTLRTNATRFLSAHGFDECYTDSLYSEATHRKLSGPQAASLANPLTQDHACLRYSLIPGLVDVLKFNWNQNNSAEKLFECGHVFRIDNQGALTELFAITLLLAFPKTKKWLTRANVDHYYLQEIAANLLKFSGHKKENLFNIQPLDNPDLWQPNYASRVANWEQKGVEITFGNINVQLLQNWFDDEVCLACECVWVPEKLRSSKNNLFQAFSEFPFIQKDLSLMVDKDIPAETVRSNVEKAARKLTSAPIEVSKVEIFDVYQPKENDKKSLALSIIFTCNSRTLTDTEINSIFVKTQEMLETQFKYNIRKAAS